MCLFLGAGASNAFGYPTTVEFIKELRDVIPHKEFFEEVVKFIENDLKEPADIEKIISQMEDLGNYIESGNEKGWFKNKYLLKAEEFGRVERNQMKNPLLNEFKATAGMIENLNNKIKEQVYHTYWIEPENPIEDYGIVYRKLFATFSSKTYHIFTTNYDISLDNLFLENESTQSEYTDGFVADYHNHKFNNDFDNQKKYKVYKLHGSVNWKRYPANSNDITRISIPAFNNLSECPMLFPGSKYSEE